MCSRFSVSAPVRFAGRLQDSAIMKANELSIGWAMKQSDPVAALQRVINNVKAYEQQARAWWDGKSETFSRLCATEEGETFTHGQVVLANLGVLLFLVVLGVAGWLEGGAA